MRIKILQIFCKEFKEYDINQKFKVLNNYKRIIQYLEEEGLIQI